MRVEVETKQVIGLPWDQTAVYNLFWAHIHTGINGKVVTINGAVWSKTPNEAISDAFEMLSRYVKENYAFECKGWNPNNVRRASGTCADRNYNGYCVVKGDT